MKALRRIVQVLLWSALTATLVWVVRRLLFPGAGQRAQGGEPLPQTPVSTLRIQLQQDPICGAYVSPEISLTLQQSGQIEHFCSQECRDRYLLSRRRAVNA